jgi:PBP1b-binding outer membrane lipoprotein LpoB
MKLALGILVVLALLFTGCGQSEQEKAKAEFKTAMLKIEPKNLMTDVEKVMKPFEDKYGQMEVKVWFEELKRTNEWQVRAKENFNSRVTK